MANMKLSTLARIEGLVLWQNMVMRVVWSCGAEESDDDDDDAY